MLIFKASILSQSGGTCNCTDPVDRTCTLNPTSPSNIEYSACLIGKIHEILLRASELFTDNGRHQQGSCHCDSCTCRYWVIHVWVPHKSTGGIGVCISPFARASNTDRRSPGMGLNAYFTYQVVGFHGTGPVTYRLALTAVFVEGFIFVFLSLIGMRQWLVKVIPPSIKVASGVGIGLFLTLIGMSYSAGIGLMTGSSSTPTDLGGCPPQYLDPETGDCTSHKMTNPTVCTLLLLIVILLTELRCG